jgi:type IV pilus biogenesis protein CpaD/CtpE
VLKKLIPVVATLLLVGCSSNPSAREEALIGLTVQYATAKYIEERPQSRETIVSVATAAKAIVGGDATATLLTLQEFVSGELDKAGLSAPDRVLANALVSLIVAELQAKVGEGLIEPDQRIRVANILDLVIAAARV